MRIIAGKYKGKILNSFKLDTTRPTSDIVRSSLFNILGDKIIDCIFLDLFGGTGACGVEAISRGSKQVYIVDKNKESVNLINKNLNLVNASAIVENTDYLTFLGNCKLKKICFDVVFIDPPYATDFGENAIKFIIENNLVCSDSVIVWEHDKTKLDYVDSLKYPNVRTKKYGIKYLTIITLNE